MRDNTETGTLLSVIDETLTSMGARMLKKSILKPLVDMSKINARLNAVEELVSKGF